MPVNIENLVTDTAKSLYFLEKQFLKLIDNQELKSNDDIVGAFDNILQVSRKAFHALREIIIYFHPIYVDFIQVDDKDKDIVQFIEGIIDGGNNLFAVYWYECLINVINERDENNKITNDGIDEIIIGLDKIKLFKYLKKLSDKCRQGKSISHERILDDTEFWSDAHNITLGIDTLPDIYWERLMELGPIIVDKEISRNIKEIYHEIRMNFANDNLISCVALCRAVLECCIYDKLQKNDKDLSSDLNLIDLIIRAKEKGILDGKHYVYANHVRKMANRILHMKDTNIEVKYENTFDVINKTALVVKALCGAEKI